MGSGERSRPHPAEPIAGAPKAQIPRRRGATAQIPGNRGATVQNGPVTDMAAALLSDLDAYAAADTREQASLSRIREFVSRSPLAFSRANPEGHVTASAVIARPSDSAFLLVWHRKLGRWLQPGGHMEPEDESVLSAALREAREETGIEAFKILLGRRILDVDVHLIPASATEQAHIHYDIRYLLTPCAGSAAPQDGEIRWFTPDEALAAGTDDSLIRALRKALASLPPPPAVAG